MRDPAVTLVIILIIGIVAGIIFDRVAGPGWLTRQLAGSTRGLVTSSLIGIAGAESDPPTASTGSIGEVVAGLRRIAAQLDLLWSSVGHGEGMSMHVGEASHAVHRALIVLNGQSSREA